MEIDYAICGMCYQESDWSEKVSDILKEEFSLEHSNNTLLSVYHRYWEVRKALWHKYEKKCLVFEYDDMVEAICKEHLQNLLEKM